MLKLVGFSDPEFRVSNKNQLSTENKLLEYLSGIIPFPNSELMKHGKSHELQVYGYLSFN